MLTVKTEPLENCEVLMTVEVDEQQADQILKAAARRISRQVQIPGFRPGKAPYRMVVGRVGEDAIKGEALDDLGESVFQQALKQAELEPFSTPAMEDIEWEPLVMKVRVPIDPIVELSEYRSLRLEFEPVEVSQEDVDEALTGLQEQRARWNVVDRPAELGDKISMTVSEEMDGELVTEGQQVEYELVEQEEDDPRPDLTTPLMGVSAGEAKSFSVARPAANDSDDADSEDDIEDDAEGNEATVSVEVHEVQEKEVFPLDDDFAQTVGDYNTLDELKEKLAADLKEERQAQQDNELFEQALEDIVSNAKRIEWHKSMEDTSLERLLEDQNQQLQRDGLSLDDFLAMNKQTREEWGEGLLPGIQDQIRRSLVVEEIAKQEQLGVEGQEMLDRIDMMSAVAGKQGDEIRQAFSQPSTLNRLAQDLLLGKTRGRLVEIVKGEYTPEVEGESETTEDQEGVPEIAEEAASESEDAQAEVQEKEESPTAEQDATEPEPESESES